MTPQTIPGKSVDGALRLVRLPANLVLSIFPNSRAATSAGLMIDRGDAAVRGVIGRVLSDSQMRDDARQRRRAADERSHALRLRAEAESRLGAAEGRTENRRHEAKVHRTKADEQAKRKKVNATRRRAQRKAEAARAADRRKDAAQEDAAEAKEGVEKRGKLDRLEQLEKKADALEVKESAVRAADEARRLEEATAKAKEGRKADSSSGASAANRG